MPTRFTKKLSRSLHASAIAAFVIAASPLHAAEATATRPDQAKFREIYKELVETDTSVATGNCTILADKIDRRLRAGGFTDAEIYRFAPSPKEGGIVVTLAGTSKAAKAVLLLGHIDVVNAPPEGWSHDSFKFSETDGFFSGRGTADMKALDAIWIDTMLRLKAQGGKQTRSLKMALTCGEEGGWPTNGARWLTENQRGLIDAQFALNEGGGGNVGPDGALLELTVGAAEKFGPNFKIEADNPGGHSSVPHPDNAIYDLSRTLLHIRELHFPVDLNDVTRAFFARTGAARNDGIGAAMRAIAADPNDREADKTLSAVLEYNPLLHTTCVPTLLEAGHATNALPQRATANINCRILPGETLATVQAALVKAVNDPAISVTFVPNDEPVAAMSPVSSAIFGPMEAAAKRHFPGAVVVPTMSTGGSDSRYLHAVGIPTYGVPGIASPLGGSGAHGINEHVGVRAVYQARDYIFDLVQAYLRQ
jgi:acetylornithine deacetylase/succinyl-diaminopimelate desuccinylase-like protein